MLIHFFISFIPIIYIIFSDLQTLRWISKINITQWQSTYGYLGSYLGWDPSAYQYGMLTYENVSVDSKESSAGIFPLTQNLNTKSNNLYLLFFSKFWIFFTLPLVMDCKISENFGSSARNIVQSLKNWMIKMVLEKNWRFYCWKFEISKKVLPSLYK